MGGGALICWGDRSSCLIGVEVGGCSCWGGRSPCSIGVEVDGCCCGGSFSLAGGASLPASPASPVWVVMGSAMEIAEMLSAHRNRVFFARLQKEWVTRISLKIERDGRYVEIPK